jgi:hypothetical protein
MWSLLLISRTLLVKSVMPAIVLAIMKRAMRRLRRRIGLRSGSGFLEPVVEVQVLQREIFQIRELGHRIRKVRELVVTQEKLSEPSELADRFGQ